MLSILPISDLRNNANEISDFWHQTREPVYITRNGTGDMVVISMEAYERQQALIDLYGKLAIAEQEIASGAEGEDFLTLAKSPRERGSRQDLDLLTKVKILLKPIVAPAEQ